MHQLKQILKLYRHSLVESKLNLFQIIGIIVTISIQIVLFISNQVINIYMSKSRHFIWNFPVNEEEATSFL